ncbi:uncharacterized protein LOC133818795 isoform X2 [Humulus lupulus]|uniref:uncharacterized protein LOC133818795 isoform X2 n=1 Tax=Humulus lupulus TaxID=3486 RepID=UPI002B40B2F0|nr:uncharacterized protein LOC133818795 isoform X2 [Humulus lupulus]
MEKAQQQHKEEFSFSTEVSQLDEAIKLLDSSLSLIKWRLKPSARTRLHMDVLALCTGMRPVIMVDYGGKMPELQERLCALLKLCQKESSIFEHLRVMIIEDMIYLVHIRGLAEHVQSSLNSELQLLFVDLEQDPLKMITQPENNPLVMQFLSVQKLFSVIFPMDGIKNYFSSCPRTDEVLDVNSLVMTLQSSYFIDLSSCLQDTQVTVPTLNGNSSSTRGSQMEELLSFSVPYGLSMGGSNEQWAKAYLAHMQMKWERCKQAWRSLQMDVSECKPQAIVL